jgi:putative glutamine amidotransferase
MSRRALVAVVADRRNVGLHPFHMVCEKYLTALVASADVAPVVVPSFGAGETVLRLLDQVDGLFLPGSPSNIESHHYDGPPSDPDGWHDPERDRDAFQLIPAAVRAEVPLLGVCRGFQEMNVAFGGSLHTRVHEVPGFQVHKEDPDDPIEIQYGPAHQVTFESGGLLESLANRGRARVNSLHGQGIDRLADGLSVEARADDGLIEAVRVSGAAGYTLGVQWHPEWKSEDDALSQVIFRSFGDACRVRLARSSG